MALSPTQIEEQHQVFDTHALQLGFTHDDLLRRKDGQYIFTVIHRAFQLWLAATERMLTFQQQLDAANGRLEEANRLLTVVRDAPSIIRTDKIIMHLPRGFIDEVSAQSPSPQPDQSADRKELETTAEAPTAVQGDEAEEGGSLSDGTLRLPTQLRSSPRAPANHQTTRSRASAWTRPRKRT